MTLRGFSIPVRHSTLYSVAIPNTRLPSSGPITTMLAMISIIAIFKRKHRWRYWAHKTLATVFSKLLMLTWSVRLPRVCSPQGWVSFLPHLSSHWHFLEILKRQATFTSILTTSARLLSSILVRIYRIITAIVSGVILFFFFEQQSVVTQTKVATVIGRYNLIAPLP